jgi:hypothetical protein
MSSRFEPYLLAGLFSDLYHAERTGALALTHREERKEFHFDRGMLVSVQSSTPDEEFGPALLRDGRVSTGALAEAERSVGAAATVAELARALVQRDLIARATASQTMADLVNRAVQSAFGWEQCQATFTDGAPLDSIFETDILTTVEVILNGVFCMGGFDKVRAAMSARNNKLRCCDPMPIPVERLTLSAAHGFILSRVDGHTPMQDLLVILPPEETEVAMRFLFGLLALRVVEYVPPIGDGPFRVDQLMRTHADEQWLERSQEQAIRQKYEQVRQQNPYEILGVTPTASRDDVARAYEQLKAQYGRDRLLPGVQERLRDEVTVIESRLVEAFLTLSQPARGLRGLTATQTPTPARDVAIQDLAVRVELDRARSQVEADGAHRKADLYFAQARRAVREGDFHNGIQFCKLAISHNPSDARCYSLLGDCQARNPEVRWQKMAEANYRKATELDPWNPDYWVSLGRLYRQRGMGLRARRYFEEALKLVPNKAEILAELSNLDG